MMKELLKMVLSLSLSGSLLILALLAARPLAKGRLSSRWRYYIWLVVVARLLLPIAPPESPVGELEEEPSLESILEEARENGHDKT